MRKAWPIAIGLTILAGILLRVGHLFFINLDEPFRLGGLFLEFSNQILKNHYSLPVTIPFYSRDGLPFAYPPLPFYVQALILALFHPAKFHSVNLIPPLVAALSVPSFYYMVRQLVEDRLEAWAALAAFVFIPNAFLDPIEAGGLSEAFGELALIGYAAFLLKVYKRPGWGTALLAGLLLGLNILASPGSAVAVPVISLVYALAAARQALRQRSLQPLYFPALIGLTGLLVSAPYWLTVIGHHGRGVFTASLSNQFQSGQKTSFLQQTLDRLLSFDLSPVRNGSFLWGGLTLLGLISYLTGAGFYLPILFILFSLLPREGIWLSALVSALLAGRGLALLSGLVKDSPAGRRGWVRPALAAFLLVAAGYGAVLAISANVKDRQAALGSAQIAALDQARAMLPQDAEVIAVGNDGFLEWSPQLLQREVVNTPYGLEWQPNELLRVTAFNRDVENAASLDDLLAAVKKRFHLQEVYLVTNEPARFSSLRGGPAPTAGTVDLVSEGDEISIYHLLIP